MKNPFLNTLIIGLTVLLVSACAQKGAPGRFADGEPGAKSGDSAPTDPSHGAPSGAAGGEARRGTLDGGGGNGINGKPIESYRVNIRELPEYKKFVEPLMVFLGYSWSDPLYARLNTVIDKNWYFVPVPLDQVPETVLGAPFRTDQIAVQNLREVYVNIQNYGSDEVAKADLIFHELAMGLRLFRFASGYQQCMAGKPKDHPANIDARLPDPQGCQNFDKNEVPKPIKLTKSDYEAVRVISKTLQETRDAMKISHAKDLENIKAGRLSGCDDGRCPLEDELKLIAA